MKFKIFIVLIILFSSKIFSLSLLKETKLETIENVDYKNFDTSPKYDIKNNNLVIILPIKNISSIGQDKFTRRYPKGIFVFSKTGKLIGKVGKINSYDKDGIIDIHSVKLEQNKIFIKEYSRTSLLCFSAER